MMKRLWCEDEGVLTFEWVMLTTLLVIGTVGGVAGIRDGVIRQAQGVVGAMDALDQSYSIAAPLGVGVYPLGSGGMSGLTSSASSSSFNKNGAYATGGVTFSNAMTANANWNTLSKSTTASANGDLCQLAF